MSKKHSELTGTNLHDPKDFAEAANSTVLSKSALGAIEWVSKDDVGGSQGPQGIQGDAVSYQNQVIVQKNAQVGQYSSVKAAIDSITDASASNRYEVFIGPGTYDEQAIVMKEYVNVRGAGRETVVINGLNNASNLITATHNCELSDVTICFSDDTGTGSALLYHGSQGAANTQAFYATNIRFGASDILCKVESTTSFVQTHLRDFDFGGSLTTSEFNYGFQSIRNGGGKPRLIMQNGRPTQQVSGARCLELFRSQGSGADLVVSNCFANSGGNYDTGDTVGAGTLSQYCFVVEDGATIRVLGGTARGYETCVYIPNTGSAPSINIQGLYTDRNQYDFDILQPSTTGNILVQGTQSKINNIDSTDLSFMLVDIESGEQGVFNLGKFKVAPGGNTNGTFDLAYLGKYGMPMGKYEGGVISVNAGLTVDITAGRGYFYDSGSDITREVIWTAKTAEAIAANSDLYVTINSAGAVATTASIAQTENSILLGRIVTNGSAIRFIENLPVQGDFSSNKILDFHRNTFGCVYESGSTVAENGTVARNLDIGSGVRWYMGNDINSAGGAQVTFTQLYKNGSGGWTETTLQTVNNTQYDDSSGTLAALTASYYSCRYLYIVGSSSDGTEKYYLQLGQAEHSAQAAAEAESPPTPPSWLKDGAVVIAQIVIQNAAANIVSVTSLKPTLGGATTGGGGAASDHGNLTGLADDDHLIYTLADGTRAFTGNIDIGGNAINNVGNVDGVDVSAHASRHLPNGADPLTTAAATNIGSTNAEGTANSFARSDHTHEVRFPNVGATSINIVEMNNLIHGTGVISGFAITDGGAGTADVGAGDCLVKDTNAITGESTYYKDTVGTTGLALTDLMDNYIYLEWNAGSPAYVVYTTQQTDNNTKILLGQVYRNGTDLHISTSDKFLLGEHPRLMSERMISTNPYAREVDGGAILTETGTRNIAISAGTFWHGISKVTTTAIDTNVADTFLYYYRDGIGGWTEVTAQTQFSNSQYDDSTGTLATMTASYYRVDWVFVGEDSDVYLQYGFGEHATLADAKADPIPTSLANQIPGHGILVGKIITQQGGASASEVLSKFDDELVSGASSDHGALGGLADDDHTQYLLASGTRAMAGDLDMGGNDITNVGAIAIPNSSVTDTVDSATTSATYVVVTTMTSTPAAGDYLVTFSSSGSGTANGANMQYALHKNGTIITHTERNMNFGGGAAATGVDRALHTQAVVTMNGTDTIDVRYLTDTGTFTMHERSMILIKVGV